MGNQPSKDNVIDSSYIRRARLGNTKLPDKLHDHSYSQKLERNKKASSNNKYSSRPVVVSPVRHQLVLTNQATPLVSLSAASVTSPVGHPSSLATLSSSSSYQRRSSESRLQDFRSMSSVSLTSEEPDTPTYSSNFARSNPSGKPIDSSYYSDPFMMGHETYVLSSSLPTEDYENGGYVTRNSKSKRDSKEMWVYEYGAEKERDRQTRQHYVLKQVLQGNIHVKLDNPGRILDSACGVGLWSLEMAQEYPGSKVTGIDVVPPSEKEGWNPTSLVAGQINSLKYQYGDIHQPLLFPDDHFDLVYQRDVATILPFNMWPTLISEFKRVLKPDGQIQLVEYDLLFRNPGPVLSQVNEWYGAAAGTIGVNPYYTDFISDHLEDAGFVNIEETVIDIPIGEWHKDDLQKQFGYLYKEQMKALFKSMKRWWCTEIKVTPQEYDRVCVEAMEEFDEYQCTARWKIFTATKPSS